MSFETGDPRYDWLNKVVAIAAAGKSLTQGRYTYRHVIAADELIFGNSSYLVVYDAYIVQ